MTVFEPRERFARLAAGPDEAIDLAVAALLIAAEEYPSLDVDAELAVLDALAEELGGELASREPDERVAALVAFLADEQGFTGNALDYEDPRNSFLNEVLARRLGIPITLSLVYMEVGRRVGVPLEGVGFPGHFLARAPGCEPRLVDAFHGRLVGEDECTALLRQALGPDAALEPALHLRRATPREILIRMLGNLKLLYVRRRDFGRALGCCERIVLLAPEAPHELRDRGLVLEQLECPGAALADLKRFLELAPDDGSAAAVRQRVSRLQGIAPRLN